MKTKDLSNKIKQISLPKNFKGINVKKSLMLIGMIASILLIILLAYHFIHPTRYIKCDQATLKVNTPYIVNGEAVNETLKIPRGARVVVAKKGEKESTVKYDGNEFKVKNSYLVKSLNDAITVDYVYPRKLVNLRKAKDGILSNKVVKKGEKVKVIDVDMNDYDPETGEIKWYHVKKDGKEYYISGRTVETTKKLANKIYYQNVQYSSYWDDYYGEGYSKDAYIDQIDYKPQKKASYENNVMPDEVNAIHVNAHNFVNNKDYMFKLKDETNINAVVVEIKSDDGLIYYDSKVIKNYLTDPDAAMQTGITTKQLKQAIEDYHDEGFYVIARIVTFKDMVFAKQNVDESLTDKDGELVLYNEQYWPSAYSRKAWMYNVDIAKEVADMGVNEIQFDYVRFPDGTSSSVDDLDFKNKYDESKVAAIQGFLEYAKEELEPKEVYVSADMFAWPVIACDDQDIGQFLPALANCVDVISTMPYLDHFSSGTFNITDVTSKPRKVLAQYSNLCRSQLNSIKYPAIYRTWIQGYSLKIKAIKAEIKGIEDAGYSGYMVWYGAGNKSDLEKIEKAFK